MDDNDKTESDEEDGCIIIQVDTDVYQCRRYIDKRTWRWQMDRGKSEQVMYGVGIGEDLRGRNIMLKGTVYLIRHSERVIVWTLCSIHTQTRSWDFYDDANLIRLVCCEVIRKYRRHGDPGLLPSIQLFVHSCSMIDGGPGYFDACAHAGVHLAFPYS